MGLVILILLCAASLLSSYCEITQQKHEQATTFISTRFKRETESDCIKRQPKMIPLSLGNLKKPVVRPIPAPHKHTNPAVIHRIVPSKRNTVPQHHIKIKEPQPLANITVPELNVTNIIDIDRKDDTDLDEFLNPEDDEKVENGVTVKNETMEQPVLETPKTLIDKVTESNTFVEEETKNIVTNQTVNDNLNSTEKDLTMNLNSKQMQIDTQADSVLTVKQSLHKTEDILKTAPEDHENLINPIKNVTDHLNTSNDGKLSMKTVPLSIFTNATILTTPKVNQVLLPKVKHVQVPQETHIKLGRKEDLDNSSHAVLRNAKEENKIKLDAKDDLVPKRDKTGPDEEIHIQNNNFEELYESSLPYLPPHINAMELCPPPNMNDFRQPFNFLERLNEPKSYEYNGNTQPYSYDVKTYPNQYVVDAYDGFKKRNNKSQQNQRNIDHPLGLNFGQRSNYFYKGIYEHPKNRIWRSWQNNEIKIKPANSVNVELFKNINEYVANARRMSVNNEAGKFISTNGKVNHSVSPSSYSDPFQLNKRYGY